MTIGAEELALFKLRPDFTPASGVTFSRNTKVLVGRLKMVDLQRINASTIAAASALSAQKIKRLFTNFLAPFLDGLN